MGNYWTNLNAQPSLNNNHSKLEATSKININTVILLSNSFYGL